MPVCLAVYRQASTRTFSWTATRRGAPPGIEKDGHACSQTKLREAYMREHYIPNTPAKSQWILTNNNEIMESIVYRTARSCLIINMHDCTCTPPFLTSWRYLVVGTPFNSQRLFSFSIKWIKTNIIFFFMCRWWDVRISLCIQTPIAVYYENELLLNYTRWMETLRSGNSELDSADWSSQRSLQSNAIQTGWEMVWLDLVIGTIILPLTSGGQWQWII